jgi:hypothetical protein
MLAAGVGAQYGVARKLQALPPLAATIVPLPLDLHCQAPSTQQPLSLSVLVKEFMSAKKVKGASSASRTLHTVVMMASGRQTRHKLDALQVSHCPHEWRTADQHSEDHCGLK